MNTATSMVFGRQNYNMDIIKYDFDVIRIKWI
jgi:hypothetical protein